MASRPFSLTPAALPVAVGPGRLSVIVTYLEMTAPPAGDPVPRPPGDLLLMRAIDPTPSFYRYLYGTVGEPWLWHERRRMSDAQLSAIVGDRRIEVHVLYASGTPAGYAEIDRRKRDSVDLAYFGLIPDFIGRKLGPWLLDQSIRMAWTGGTRRLTVNTCTFDHPRALPLYQSLGFAPIRSVVREIDDPRVKGPLPRTAGPHIPIIE